MSLTIYTVSDPATIGGALQAMAMFFGQEDWVGTAIKTGLMLSLIFILAQGVTRNGLRLDVMLVQLIVVWAMFMPKTTVTVEQFDNAAPPRVVDNIPYAIALPASVAGAFALYMTRNIEATMVNVDGDYLSISGASHPFNPARALMAITMCPSDPMGCADQNLVETMRLAARFCTNGEFANVKFSAEPNVLDAFASKMTLDAQVIIYDKSNPYIPGGGGGRVASCSESAQYLRDIATMEKNGAGIISTSMGGLAARSEVKKYGATARAEDNQTRSWDEALQDINKLRDANSKMDSLAFANVTLYSLADAMKTNANAPIDQAITIRKDSGLFEWAKAEATQSMLVSTTAPKFMDILFFVFIASTPIVMFVVAANPTGGLKVAGSYALFGMWTQSWIPMMAIIMSWYQGEIKNISSPLQFTPEYMAFFMRHVYTSTIAASNMMQQAPYIMFAIMTGSMMAMSGLVSKAMPSGGKGAGGGVGSGGSASSEPMTPGIPKGAIPGAAMRNAIGGGQAVFSGGSLMSPAGMAGDASSALPGIAKLDVGGAASAGSSTASSLSASTRAGIQTQAQKAYSDIASMIESAGKKIGGAQMAQHMRNAGFDASFDANTGTIKTEYGSFDVSNGQTNSTSMQSGLKVGASFDSGKQLGGKAVALATGLSVAAAVDAGIGSKQQQDVNAKAGNGQKSELRGGTGSAVKTNSGESASAGTTGTSGSDWSKMASDAKSLQNTISKLASMSESLDKADALTKQGAQTASASVGQQIDGAQVVSNWGNQAPNTFKSAASSDGEAQSRVASLVQSSLSPEQQQKFGQLAAAESARMRENGSAIGLSKDQVAMAAGWSALADIAASSKSPEEKLSAQTAMAQLGKAAGLADVSSSLNAVRDGLAQVKDVEKNLDSMGKKVEPEASAAVAQGNSQLSEKGVNAFNNNVADTIKAEKGTAERLNGSANAGYDSVKAEGASRQLTADKNALDGVPMDPNKLMPIVHKANNNQSFAPERGDIGQFGMGNNTSAMHNWFGKREDGANNGVTGPKGASNVPPAQTLPGYLSGATSMVGGAAGSLGSGFPSVGDLTKGVGGATSQVQGAASSISGATSNTTVVMQNAAGNALPTLGGGGGGMNLTPTQSGGGSSPAPATSTGPAKPYAASGGKAGDSSKPKTPGRGR